MDEEKRNESEETVAQEDAERNETAVTVGEEKPPCARRIYARRRRTRRKPETADERFERIIKQATPPRRPPHDGRGLDPDEQVCRTKRTLTQLREHCRKRGISHPLFDENYGKEVTD